MATLFVCPIFLEMWVREGRGKERDRKGPLSETQMTTRGGWWFGGDPKEGGVKVGWLWGSRWDVSWPQNDRYLKMKAIGHIICTNKLLYK